MELRQLFDKGGCEGKTYRGGTERQVFKDTKRYILRHKDIKNIFKVGGFKDRKTKRHFFKE